MWRTLWVAVLVVLGAGCASGPMPENPVLVRPGAPPDCPPNPVYVPLGPEAYSLVFETVLEVLSDTGFEIREANRYDGRVETLPETSAGLLRPCSPGSPEFAQRLMATFQSYRNRASVKISPADNGGFFIQVAVYRELENLPQPVRMTAGAAVFYPQNSVDRRLEVVDPTVFETQWIPKGRDIYMERLILERLRERI